MAAFIINMIAQPFRAAYFSRAKALRVRVSGWELYKKYAEG